METCSKFFIGFLASGLVVQTAFGQTKKTSDSAFVKAQIKPKFSEMADYGLPVSKEGVHEFPGGKAPASNQINRDGSIRVSKTGEITLPAETITTKKEPNTTGPDAASGNNKKAKKKK
jgi:hypothetical protein